MTRAPGSPAPGNPAPGSPAPGSPPPATGPQATPAGPPRLSPRASAFWALLLLVPAPSIGAGIWLHVDPGPVGRAIFIFSKVWLLLFPLAWHCLVDRQRPVLPALPRRGLGAGLLSGVAIFAIIVGAYLLVPAAWFNPAAISEVIREAGFASPRLYVGFALYYCLVNALLEEYVWRWFVFRKSETLLPWAGGAAAAAAAGLFFTLHHTVAMTAYLSWPVVALASLGVFSGGVIWSGLYLRYRSIWPGYLSHVLADAAIFLIGYQLVFGN